MTRLAIRLLQLVRGRSDDDPLVGDLLEEHARRNSLLWLWKQVVVAIAAAMLERTTFARAPRGLALVAGATLVVLAFIMALGLGLNGAFVPFALVILTGGAGMALVRFVLQANDVHAPIVPDAFARDQFANASLNFAHVRVAGLGGSALIVVVACVAIEIHAIGIAMIAAVVGGVLFGAALVFHRTHHHRAAPIELTR